MNNTDEVLKEIAKVLKQNPNDFEGVRRVLRNTKSKHSEINTRDINISHHIPGFRFLKRNNMLYLERDYTGRGINPMGVTAPLGVNAVANELIQRKNQPKRI